MQTVVLNGEVVSEQTLSRMAKALSTPDIITEKGGYLFKSRVDDDAFHFGILPNFLNDGRTYHYDIDIGPGEFNLTGSINANGSLTVLFKPDPAKIGAPLSEADKEEYRRQYAQLARFLVECGLPPSLPLDSISAEVLREARLCEERPITLARLAT